MFEISKFIGCLDSFVSPKNNHWMTIDLVKSSKIISKPVPVAVFFSVGDVQTPQDYAVLLWNHDSHKLVNYGASQREVRSQGSHGPIGMAWAWTLR